MQFDCCDFISITPTVELDNYNNVTQRPLLPMSMTKALKYVQYDDALDIPVHKCHARLFCFAAELPGWMCAVCSDSVGRWYQQQSECCLPMERPILWLCYVHQHCTDCSIRRTDGTFHNGGHMAESDQQTIRETGVRNYYFQINSYAPVWFHSPSTVYVCWYTTSYCCVWLWKTFMGSSLHTSFPVLLEKSKCTASPALPTGLGHILYPKTLLHYSFISRWNARYVLSNLAPVLVFINVIICALLLCSACVLTAGFIMFCDFLEESLKGMGKTDATWVTNILTIIATAT